MAAEGDVQRAAQGLVDEGEVIVSWVMTLDVLGPNGVRYLAHRGGGGVDGDEGPTMWGAAGMLQCSADAARDQMRESTEDSSGEDES